MSKSQALTMPKRDHITLVCTANICRSPMAEALLRHALDADPEPLLSLKITSAGISSFDGDPASGNALKAVKKVGLDITKHKSKTLNTNLVKKSFAIFCMTQSHRLVIDVEFGNIAKNVYLFKELMGGNRGFDIPDPFGLNLPEYEVCRDSMVEAIPSIVNWLKSNYKG